MVQSLSTSFGGLFFDEFEVVVAGGGEDGGDVGAVGEVGEVEGGGVVEGGHGAAGHTVDGDRKDFLVGSKNRDVICSFDI